MDRGLLMKPPLIVATMKDLKTETRRLRGLKEINKEPDNFGLPHLCKSSGLWSIGHFPDGMRECLTEADADGCHDLKCPYGVVGDRLYIKEEVLRTNDVIWYKVDGLPAACQGRWQWKNAYLSPLYMPKKCARTWLKIIGMSLERLQEITLGGIVAEGIAKSIYEFKPVQRGFGVFAGVWDKINPDYPWELSPWVWVPKWKREK